ncbi:unnamed protein product [Enterobius vermicularis]|uniref:Protein KRI1 homolog n=1 Tax=Enterobius vermicularis TaxID=51028 RepID=A0A0N4V3J2_ENTVE|nr:unnamed protein product [Enterobius vermicularis]
MVKLKLDLDNDGNDELTINSAYADRYDNWRRLEEIQKLKSRVRDDEDEESSESSEEEAEWTADHEKDFLLTLTALKTKDPKIYSQEQIFKAEPGPVKPKSESKKKKSEEKLYLKDYERKLVLERGGIIDEEDNEELRSSENTLGYYQKQAQLKNELKHAWNAGTEVDFDVLLKKKEKSEVELKKEEDDYYEWLKDQSSKSNKKFERLASILFFKKGLKEIWSNDRDLDSEEKFLRDFLLEKKYEVDELGRIPSLEGDASVSADEDEVEREEEFEQKYNFRFEEPDKDFIKQYPRSVKESLRKTGEKRKEKRTAYKERKDAEKRARKDEIRELKALKRKEIEAKLQKLKQLAGDDIEINFNDIEDDFDPAVYDKRMEAIFNKEYYDKGDEDEEKPCFSEMSDMSEEEGSNSDQAVRSPAADEKSSLLETNFQENPFREKSMTARKKKRNSRFWNVVAKKKPLFDPAEGRSIIETNILGTKSFEEYFNEYYALDYEDIIGDTITKFKYRKVPANDFGLTAEEILHADDRQLNAWASLKKVTAYRTDREEQYDAVAYQRKAQDVNKKKRIFSTDYGGKSQKKSSKQLKANGSSTHGASAIQNSDIMQKKQKVILHEQDSEKIEKIVGERVEQADNKTGKRTRRKRKSKTSQVKKRARELELGDERLRAYGVNPKKFKKKLKYLKKTNADIKG